MRNSCKRKINKFPLKKDVERYPDAYQKQKERAVRFGVCQKAIWQALKNYLLPIKKHSAILKQIKIYESLFSKNRNLSRIRKAARLH
ncbi:IS630 transposase-related protein [Candidatus Arsenophonus triatominarum]|uniref:IS630 transposase-related protein n=1 Tax=Candidatus Arsenophonus triatominarum TaxID=57911 RepID=UPI0007C5A29F|nr:IS630 transposase-related protein [Candidatus Arsenophonus triatominarum]